MSSVGKGITSASMGALLQSNGLRVTAVKADPYINVDAGTMNPTEHGEVFVTRDGDETDQDMGNYERFLDTELTATNYMTTGRVYQTVIERERSMAYGGKCVEVVPHIPEEIIRRIENAARVNKADVTIIEIGGTVGEYQNLLFLEAAREMKLRNPKDVVFVLVSYLPIPANVGEMKTKPTQYASRTLNSTGIQADFIVCRGERLIDAVRQHKLATSCGVAPEAIISAPDMPSIYEVPLLLEDAGMGAMVLKRLGIPSRERSMKDWRVFIKKIKRAKRTVKIAVVGKYFATGDFTLKDSYISVIESLKHAAWFQNCRPELTWIDSTVYEKQPSRVKELKDYDGVLVPGGFGSRGIEGIIAAIRFVREHTIPFFGLCYGMQLACVEIARHVAGIRDAHSVEVRLHTKHPIIIANPYQQKNLVNKRYGGTMRLGTYPCVIAPGTRARAAYGSAHIEERHRHRYEFNNAYRAQLEKAGVVFSGVYQEQNLVEIIELPAHPWFVAVQFHPEFKSRPMRPHPLFRAFIVAAMRYAQRGLDNR